MSWDGERVWGRCVIWRGVLDGGRCSGGGKGVGVWGGVLDGGRCWEVC